MLARMKRFNTAGPCNPAWHYIVPPEARLPQARVLAEQGAYFVLHAPRQTGKTTLIGHLARALTAEGRFAALHFSCEMGKAFTDIGLAEGAVLGGLEIAAECDLPPELQPPPAKLDVRPGNQIIRALTLWARRCPRPIVLFVDEIDALRGEVLVSVLGQLRAGYEHRPQSFPHALALCGLRDVRDYKRMSGGDPSRVGSSSPFNVKVESLKLGIFGRPEVEALYRQHTDETGQRFTPEAMDAAWELSQGQPWLANAVAREVVEKIAVPPEAPIEVGHVDEAKERLILERQTHLDSLVARLMEPRVRRLMEPLLAGELPGGDVYDEDVRYLRDLGLVAPDDPLRVANPIYREVIVRVLSGAASGSIDIDPQSFVEATGRLDLERLLDGFRAFWVRNGEVLARGMPYHEAAPQLVMMAWCQRVVNGGGYIDREYGVGRRRVDLLIRWPWTDAAGARRWQREALELKVWRDGRPDPLDEGLAQLDVYLDRLGLETGVVAIFDVREGAAPIHERTRFEQAESPAGRRVTVLRG